MKIDKLCDICGKKSQAVLLCTDHIWRCVACCDRSAGDTHKRYNGQFCPICDVWVELPVDQPDQSYVSCSNGHNLIVSWADLDYEDYHLLDKTK